MTWTAERLDALPRYTIIRVTLRAGIDVILTRGVRGWHGHGASVPFTSEDVMVRAQSIRVVSVPIDALLHPAPASVALGRIDPTSEGALMVLRAAIAHLTGEAP